MKSTTQEFKRRSKKNKQKTKKKTLQHFEAGLLLASILNIKMTRKKSADEAVSLSKRAIME